MPDTWKTLYVVTVIITAMMQAGAGNISLMRPHQVSVFQKSRPSCARQACLKETTGAKHCDMLDFDNRNCPLPSTSKS